MRKTSKKYDSGQKEQNSSFAVGWFAENFANQIATNTTQNSKNFPQDRRCQIQYNGNGGFCEFVYFGIESGLQECVNVDLNKDKVIEMQFNVDPVPSTKSGTQQFTPILCKVHYDPDIHQVFPVATYHRKAKVEKPRNIFGKVCGRYE